jgi:hypothetical protein
LAPVNLLAFLVFGVSEFCLPFSSSVGFLDSFFFPFFFFFFREGEKIERMEEVKRERKKKERRKKEGGVQPLFCLVFFGASAFFSTFFSFFNFLERGEKSGLFDIFPG